MCIQLWPYESSERLYFLSAIFVTCYTIPLIGISACYTMIGYRVCNRNAPGIQCDTSGQAVVQRSKVKVLKMLITVVILFAFSWLPTYVVLLRIYYGEPLDDSSFEFKLLVQVVMPVMQWAGRSSWPSDSGQVSRRTRHAVDR